MKNSSAFCSIIWGKGGGLMRESQIQTIMSAIDFIEQHLQEKLSLDQIAAVLNYSKFHLHREFVRTVGLTMGEYAVRRRLTEAARFLRFSRKPILEIALSSGYGSQQAFTDIFRAMYKASPGQFRKEGEFYPLQLKMSLGEQPSKDRFSKKDIQKAKESDVSDWMYLTSLVIDGYPCLDEAEHRRALCQSVKEGRAFVIRDGHRLAGAVSMGPQGGRIDFLAVHPQYKNLEIENLFVGWIMQELLPGEEIDMTTYRQGDRADTGHRRRLWELGFEGRELLWEYGYPVQRFVLSPKKWEEIPHNEDRI